MIVRRWEAGLTHWIESPRYKQRDWISNANPKNRRWTGRECLNKIYFWHETIIISKMINDCIVCECVRFASSTRDWNNEFIVLLTHKYMHKVHAISLFNWRRCHCVIVIVERGRTKLLHRSQARASKCVSIDYMLFMRGIFLAWAIHICRFGSNLGKSQEVVFLTLYKFVTCVSKSITYGACWWVRIIRRDSMC